MTADERRNRSRKEIEVRKQAKRKRGKEEKRKRDALDYIMQTTELLRDLPPTPT